MKGKSTTLSGYDLAVTLPLPRFYRVGAAGVEPATSCSQSRRDNRATLRPAI